MEGRLSLSLRVVLSCHGMLCWLPAGPGGCSVAGRDQTGTQSLFPVSLFPPFPISLCVFQPLRDLDTFKNWRADIHALFFCVLLF
jgi:hypothetical protein